MVMAQKQSRLLDYCTIAQMLGLSIIIKPRIDSGNVPTSFRTASFISCQKKSLSSKVVIRSNIVVEARMPEKETNV
jgi:hypothetical protein